jgi:nicotinate dehydrogenase subunit A
MARLTLHVNGKAQVIEVDDPDMPLLYALRDDLGLNNPRFGCGLGQCGACTVHEDGRAHPVQTAWIEEQVNQCAYCINGWIMTAAELLAHNPHPTETEIKDALGDLICRCGTHAAALRAVKRAAQSA